MKTADAIGQVRRVAEILLPGDAESPSAEEVERLDEFIAQAIAAMGPETQDLSEAIEALPRELSWEALQRFSDEDRAAFDLVSTVAAAAYFMSPSALASINYPQGARRAPRNDQIVDELETGVLDAVMSRESMVREVPT